MKTVDSMNANDDERMDEPTFVHHKSLALLERQLYGHILAAIDFDAIHRHEEHVCLILMKDDTLDKDLALDLSTQMVTAALQRAINGPLRFMSFGPPEGITPEEAAAVAFDESCELCLAGRQQAAREAELAAAPEQAHDEYCACCDMLARDWRSQHKDVLVKAGLWRNEGIPPS